MRWAQLLSSAVLFSAALGCTRGDNVGARNRTNDAHPGTENHLPTEQGDESSVTGDERVSERRALAQAVAEAGVDDPRVLGAIEKVQRHRFVPEAVRGAAYSDRPLPIGHGQTISQPYIVASMTEAAKPRPGAKCLEIGTGSGYQAAVLAELCEKVYSIEYIPEVATFGAQNLRRAGYGPSRVELRVGDGYRGWPEAAPFNVILVTAAPEEVPPPLLEQLAVGGYLVIPVGPGGDIQYLERWKRLEAGQGPEAFDRDRLMGVRFVPFLGDAGAR